MSTWELVLFCVDTLRVFSNDVSAPWRWRILYAV